MSQPIQYTVRNVPPAIDAQLKAQAKKQGISLNKLLLAKLGAVAKAPAKPKIYHDLDWFFDDTTAESIADAEGLDKVIREQRRKDRDQAQQELDAEKAADSPWD